MMDKWRHLISRLSLPEDFLLTVEITIIKIKYYFWLSFTVAGTVVALWGFREFLSTPGTLFQPVKFLALSRIISGTFAIGVGGRYAYLAFRHKQRYSEDTCIDSNVDDYIVDDDASTIYIGTGNYNENVSGNHNKFIARDNIEGDLIKVRGDFININSDLSEINDQLLEIVTRLRDEGRSKEEAQQLVTNDLVNQAKNNPIVKVKLRRWRQSIGNMGNESSLSEAATAIVQAATETSLSVPSTEVIQVTLTPDTILSDLEPTLYQQLENFLRAGNWKEADQATASIILSSLLDKYDQYLMPLHINRHIESFSSEDLRFINDLWLKYSQGRFGFSVQKDIWREVDRDYHDFGECVGWYVEDHWIYHSDITYSPKAPRGHLPILVLIAKGFHYSQSCYHAKDSLEIFASRLYKIS